MVNPTPMRDETFFDYLEERCDIFMNKSAEGYVVYNNKLEILYKGDLPHCFIYYQEFCKNNDYIPNLTSYDYYHELYMNYFPEAKECWEEIRSLID